MQYIATRLARYYSLLTSDRENFPFDGRQRFFKFSEAAYNITHFVAVIVCGIVIPFVIRDIVFLFVLLFYPKRRSAAILSRSAIDTRIGQHDRHDRSEI